MAARSIVVDFFAGSGTTGHAVASLNALDNCNRRYILAQLPEPLDSVNKDQKTAAEFCDQIGKPRTIAELTKERLRRAGKKIKEQLTTEHTESTEKNMSLAFNSVSSVCSVVKEVDLGFRVFKLDTSNIRAWNPNPADLEASLFDHQDHLLEGRTEQDILYELLLKLGLDLCVPIEIKEITTENTDSTESKQNKNPSVNSVSSVVNMPLTVHPVGGGVLLACLAEQITREQVEPLAQGIIEWRKKLAPAGDTTCVFRDSAFADDVAKTNLAAILQQHGIQNVRSL